MRESSSLAALVVVAALIAAGVMAFAGGPNSHLAQAPRERPPSLWVTR